MTSKTLTLSGSPQVIGNGATLQAIIYVSNGGVGRLRLTADNKQVQIISRERFILTGPNARSFEASDFSMTGTGEAVIYLQDAPSEPIPPDPFQYSSRVSFSAMLDSAFDNLFVAGGYVYTLKGGSVGQTIRVCIEDQQILVGDGITQAQGIQRTGMFIVDDLPDGWGVGDTVVYGGITYRTVEVLEQDEYTVTMSLNRQAK